MKVEQEVNLLESASSSRFSQIVSLHNKIPWFVFLSVQKWIILKRMKTFTELMMKKRKDWTSFMFPAFLQIHFLNFQLKKNTFYL